MQSVIQVLGFYFLLLLGQTASVYVLTQKRNMCTGLRTRVAISIPGGSVEMLVIGSVDVGDASDLVERAVVALRSGKTR